MENSTATASDGMLKPGSAMPRIGASGEYYRPFDQEGGSSSRSSAIGMEAGSALLPGGSRSAELLQLFIENL